MVWGDGAAGCEPRCVAPCRTTCTHAPQQPPGRHTTSAAPPACPACPPRPACPPCLHDCPLASSPACLPAGKIWEYLRSELEMDGRFKTLESKLNLIQDNLKVGRPAGLALCCTHHHAGPQARLRCLAAAPHASFLPHLAPPSLQLSCATSTSGCPAAVLSRYLAPPHALTLPACAGVCTAVCTALPCPACTAVLPGDPAEPQERHAGVDHHHPHRRGDLPLPLRPRLQGLRLTRGSAAAQTDRLCLRIFLPEHACHCTASHLRALLQGSAWALCLRGLLTH